MEMKYNLNIKIAKRTLIDNITIDFKYDSICILGNHSCGKTTLLKTLKNKNSKFKYYFLEKSNTYEIKEDFELKNNQEYLPYLKALFKKIANKPEILIIDDISSVFPSEDRSKIFKYLKNKGIKILYCTSDVEDLENFSYTIVISNKMVAMEGKTSLILQEEKLMKLLGYSLPFYVNLSTQLKYYGVLDKICYNKEELGDNLWK